MCAQLRIQTSSISQSVRWVDCDRELGAAPAVPKLARLPGTGLAHDHCSPSCVRWAGSLCVYVLRLPASHRKGACRDGWQPRWEGKYFPPTDEAAVSAWRQEAEISVPDCWQWTAGSVESIPGQWPAFEWRIGLNQ